MILGYVYSLLFILQSSVLYTQYTSTVLVLNIDKIKSIIATILLYPVTVKPEVSRPMTHSLPQQPGRPSAVAAPKPYNKSTGMYSC